MRVSLTFPLCALNQRFIKSSTLPVLSFANPLVRERLCFPHPAVMSTVSQLVGKTFSQASNAILPLEPVWASDPSLPEPWKRVKAQATDGRTRPELWRNPTLLRVGELEGRKGRERGKRNGSGWK